MKSRFITLFLVCVVLAVASIQVTAQELNEPEACFTIADEAFTQTSTSCAANELGHACYGFPDAIVEFLEDTTLEADAFSEPGDRVILTEITGVVTESININANSWGVVTINAQASLPTELIEDQLDGKGLIYLVPGGITMTDATLVDDALEPLAEGIAVSTIAAADLRAAPIAIDETEISNVTGRIPGESTVSADAITPDNEWVRVVFEGQPGWISSAVLNAEADLSDLTVIGDDSFTPMQSFQFTLADDIQSACQTVPDGIIVQGPFGIPVDFTVEGIPVRLGSMAFVTRIEVPRPQVCITALSGLVTLFPNLVDSYVLIPPGFIACIDIETGEIVTVGALDDSGIRPLTNTEATLLNTILDLLPENILHYLPPIIDIIDPSGIGQPLASISILGDPGNLVQQACSSGALSPTVCTILGIATS